MGVGVLGYAAVFLASLSLAFVLTPVARAAARRWQIFDHPASHKAHVEATPYLGGMAIMLAFAATVLAGGWVVGPPSTVESVAVIVTAGVALSLVGLLDDLRGLGPAPRLVAEALAGVVVWQSDLGAELFGIGWIDACLTVLWVIVVINAFNFLDNMDGLAAGVATIAAIFYFAIAASNGQFLVATLAAGMAGCSLGFLRHNFHPAQIYMGDAGSMFIGFLLAVIGLRLRFESPQLNAAFIPVVVIGVALFDFTLVFVSRIAHGLNPMSGGLDHTSHRLVAIGVPVRAAVSLIYAGAIGCGWLALVLARLDQLGALFLVGFLATVALVCGGLLALVPVYVTSTRRAMALQPVISVERSTARSNRPLRSATAARRAR